MTRYKITKMNTGDRGEHIFTVNRIDGNELVPVRPIKYYKTHAGAVREIRRRMKEIKM